MEILRHGGTLPDAETRAELIEALDRGQEGWSLTPGREFVYAVLEHPDNAALRAQTSDGEWHGAES
jgi:hypothetical protein